MTRTQDMNAVSIDGFGGVEALRVGRLPIPDVGPGQVRIRVAYAGVGTWDPLEREGVFVEITGARPAFPLVLGRDGSGTITAMASDVDGFAEGDEVYAVGAGFYAEYAVVDANAVARVPRGLSLAEAGAMPIVGLTAVRGLVDELRVAPGETLVITGASGDVGHLAVQLGSRLGARVLAVASGADGAAVAEDLGADVAVDGRTDDVAAAVRGFAPAGADAVLSLVGGQVGDVVLAALHPNGRLAYPLGVRPEPPALPGGRSRRYDLTLDDPAVSRRTMDALNELVTAGPFEVRLAGEFALAEADAAHRALDGHRLGKVVLNVGG